MMPTDGLIRFRSNLDRAGFVTLGHSEQNTDHGAFLVEILASDDRTILAMSGGAARTLISVLRDGTVLETRAGAGLEARLARVSSQPRRGLHVEVSNGGFSERLRAHRTRVAEWRYEHGAARRFTTLDRAVSVLQSIRKASFLPALTVSLAGVIGMLFLTLAFLLAPEGAGASPSGTQLLVAGGFVAAFLAVLVGLPRMASRVVPASS